MKEAIRKAYEGGYKPKKLNSEFKWSESSVEETYDVDRRDCLLDPLFWIALGKSLGWGMACDYCGYDVKDEKDMEGWCPICETEGARAIPKYKQQWHSFINHLIARRGIESFFEELLK